MAVDSNLSQSKAKDYYRINMIDASFTLEPQTEFLMPERTGRRKIHIASAHNSCAVAFMDLNGT